ncbi:uncharacterized protein [Paramisgurnus dabryanus]|uniref:uncharacterized protein n=1 Tax=Paramisgurnus dabryanus TaxID=90735 RepID=UPI0031F3D46D
MKVSKTKPKCLLVLILTFYIAAVQSKASSHDEDLRVLIVGDERHVRYSTEVLLGKKESRQMNDTVITDDGQKMIVVSGPNPCFKNTEESFKTALFLSSPGPHAVLMALDPEDPESEQCDVLKHLHESLGSEVLQYCIVLLLQQQHHPEKAEDITVGKAREMINTCGGRFHRITDPRPALIAEINKLLWLNERTFYSLEIFKTLQDTEQTHIDEDAVEEDRLFTVICQTLGVTTAVVGLSLLLFLNIVGGILFGNLLRLLSGFVVLTAIEVTLRNNLTPEVSIPLNLVLSSSITVTVMIGRKSGSPETSQILKDIGNTLFVFTCVSFVFCSNMAVGVFTSIRSWSDVIIMCHTALGITVSIITMSFFNERNTLRMRNCGPLVQMFVSFLCCIAGMTLLIGFVTLLNQIDIKITTTLYILGLTVAYYYFKG